MITINGKTIEEKEINLLDYIIKEGFNVDRIAVELNGKIVKRGSYGEYVISNGDKVEIVCFVGGG